MLNLSSIPSSLTRKDEVTLAITSNLLKAQLLQKLNNFYPQEGFERCVRDSGPKKHYSFDLLELVRDNSINDSVKPFVNPIWIELSQTLLCEKYHDLISKHLNLNLKNAKINVGLYKFKPGDWVAPHIDNEDKILTQIFYFNDYWSMDWGGHFKLLTSNDIEGESFSVPPFSNFSVMLVRNDKAWHMVTPVESIAQQPRLSMQLEFIKRS